MNLQETVRWLNHNGMSMKYMADQARIRYQALHYYVRGANSLYEHEEESLKRLIERFTNELKEKLE